VQPEGEIAASGLTTLEDMLSVVRNEEAPAEHRERMVAAAAPYCRPRLSSVQVARTLARV